MPDDAAAHVELEFSNTGYAVRFGGETTDAGTYALAADGTPRGITMTGRVGVNQGRTLPGIVQLQGDRLRVCFSLEGDTAPNAFAAQAGTLCYLATYRRKA